MRLNKEQYRAAMHIGGPMLVLAGPGSGKTHLLVERIRILIEDAQIRPENILVITFSKKAAREMQARFNQRTKDRSYPVTFGTFHAVFYNILKDFDPATNTLITEEQKNEYIRRAVIMTKAASGLCDDGDIESLAGFISSYRNFGDDYFEQSYEGRQMDAGSGSSVLHGDEGAFCGDGLEPGGLRRGGGEAGLPLARRGGTCRLSGVLHDPWHGDQRLLDLAVQAP